MTSRRSPNHHWVALVAALATGAEKVSLCLALASTVRSLRFNGRGSVRTVRTPDSCLMVQACPDVNADRKGERAPVENGSTLSLKLLGDLSLVHRLAV
jgi:hypothetical protein